MKKSLDNLCIRTEVWKKIGSCWQKKILFSTLNEQFWNTNVQTQNTNRFFSRPRKTTVFALFEATLLAQLSFRPWSHREFQFASGILTSFETCILLVVDMLQCLVLRSLALLKFLRQIDAEHQNCGKRFPSTICSVARWNCSGLADGTFPTYTRDSRFPIVVNGCNCCDKCLYSKEINKIIKQWVFLQFFQSCVEIFHSTPLTWNGHIFDHYTQNHGSTHKKGRYYFNVFL